MRLPSEQSRYFEEPKSKETIEITTQQIENISNEILRSPELLRYFRNKIQQKIDFKQRILYDDGSNDYYPWKRLGIFIVHEEKLPNKLVSILQRNGVDVHNDEVLELHIPPQQISFGDIKKSFDRLREYLEVNQRRRSIPKYIYGVSYLAKLAKRWGFTVVDLPKSLQEKSGAARVLQSYARAVKDTKKSKIAKRFSINDIKLCYISVDELLRAK